MGDGTDDNAAAKRIETRIRDFDLVPLLRCLENLGYQREEIFFRSNSSGTASASLVEGIEFLDDPIRRVELTLNMGLLGPNGLLPSYFLEVVERATDPTPFFDFIKFFDHTLLTNHLKGVYPENDSQLYDDWDATKRFYFRMLGVGSLTTLHWLFRAFFPELEVRVERSKVLSTSEGAGFRTGYTKLDGTGIMGKSYSSDASGFLVRLYAPEPDRDNEPWAHLAEKRLVDDILPILSGSTVQLRVVLCILSEVGETRLERDGFLGHGRMGGGGDAIHEIVVHEGPPPQSSNVS